MSTSPTAPSRGGIDLPTLLTTAVASAVAAYVTSQLWAPGTLAAAAFTPVLVAVLKEALAKPAEAVTRAVPVRGVVRSASRAGEPEEARAADTPEAIEARIAQLGEAPGVSRPDNRRRNWQIAVVTGLLGFLIAAVIITVPELVAGSSASGGGRDTTFFGGKKGASSAPTDTSTTTTPSETEPAEPVETVAVPPPAETITVPPPSPTPVPEGDQGPTPPPAEEPVPEVPATPQPPPPPG